MSRNESSEDNQSESKEAYQQADKDKHVRILPSESSVQYERTDQRNENESEDEDEHDSEDEHNSEDEHYTSSKLSNSKRNQLKQSKSEGCSL